MSKRSRIFTHPYRWLIEPGDGSAWANITPDSNHRGMTIHDKEPNKPQEIYITPSEKRDISNRNKVGF